MSPADSLQGLRVLVTRPAGQADRLVELDCLLQRILARAAVDHEHDLVRGFRVDFLHDAHDFRELVHEIGLGMQAAGRVGDQDIGLARGRSLDGVVDHRGAVGAGMLRNNGHAVALAPGLDLLDGCRAEGVAGGQHDARIAGVGAAGDRGDDDRAVAHLRAPTVDLDVDRGRAADLGVSAVAIGRTIRTLLAGEKVGSFEEGGRRHDVRVQVMPEYRDDPAKIDLIRVRLDFLTDNDRQWLLRKTAKRVFFS